MPATALPPHEAAPSGRRAGPPAPIHSGHLRAVGVVRHAVKQVDDPLRIQLKGGHLLPEASGAVLIRTHKLSLRQLARQLKDQLALLEVRKGQGGGRRPILCTPPAAGPSAGGIRGGLRPPPACRLLRLLIHRLFHRLRSRGGLNTLHSRQRPLAPPLFAMKRIPCYIGFQLTRAGGNLPW